MVKKVAVAVQNMQTGFIIEYVEDTSTSADKTLVRAHDPEVHLQL